MPTTKTQILLGAWDDGRSGFHRYTLGCNMYVSTLLYLSQEIRHIIQVGIQDHSVHI